MKTGCLLHIEDDSNDVFFLTHALAEAGVPNPIRVAQDGQKAIDYLTAALTCANLTLYPWPELVLLDLTLPKVTGLGVLQWIRQQSRLKDLSVLILTALLPLPHFAFFMSDPLCQPRASRRRFVLFVQSPDVFWPVVHPQPLAPQLFGRFD